MENIQYIKLLAFTGIKIHQCTFLILTSRITHTVVLDDPFDDPVGLEVPPKSPEPTKDLTEVLSLLLILNRCTSN
jgi:hypothetical protein